MATPVLISSSYANQLGVQLAPIFYNNAYWVPLTDAQSGTGTLTMWKSVDGVTWTDAGDTLTNVVDSAFTAYYDAPSKSILCLVQVTTGGGEIVLVRYDLAGGSWGAPFGAITVGVGTGPLTNIVVQRSDGSIVGTSANKFWVWNGATWTSFPIYTNIPAGFVGGLQSNAVFYPDASGLIHSITLLENPGNTEQAYFYQQFTAVNTLGNFAALTSILFPALNFGLVPSNVIVNNTKGWVAFAALDNSSNARVFVGQLLANPVWTLSAALDSTLLSTDFGIVPTLTNYNDTKVWLLQPEADDQTFALYGSTNVTAPTLGWTLITTVVAPGPMTIFEDNWQATADAFGSVFFTEELAPSFNAESFFALGGPIPPPPPPPSVTVIAGPMIGGLPIAGITALPNAAVKCDVDGRKKCVIVKDLRPIQRSVK